MKIKMLALSAGPHGSYQRGAVVDVPLEEGRAMVAGGYAVALVPEYEMKARVVETATVTPIEVRAKPKTKWRRKAR